MGRGIALQFKKRYPDNYDNYEVACKRGNVVPGKVFVYETNSLINPNFSINFPTKRHWRSASRMEDIETGLDDLVKVIRELKITSIAIPPLGCGLGGLCWNEVKSRMETAFMNVGDVDIEIFEPSGAPAAENMARNRDIPRMTNGRAALISLIQKYLDGLLDPIVTLLEIHKLMYFLQERGEVLRLQYNKAHYGPFALNLSHVLNAVEGHFLSGYADGGDNPSKQIQIVPGAGRDAATFLEQNPETCARIDSVAKLVDGFETPFGMELLSTVHWVVKDKTMTICDIIAGTYEWSTAKKKFSERQIEIAVNRLVQEGWITKPI
jgi:O-acetyl-ADP-ribose deacetylase (regulator of RNase III)